MADSIAVPDPFARVFAVACDFAHAFVRVEDTLCLRVGGSHTEGPVSGFDGGMGAPASRVV